MKQNELTKIKRRPDGSIDTAYYMAIGRQCRAEQAQKITTEVLRKPKFFSFRFWPLGPLTAKSS